MSAHKWYYELLMEEFGPVPTDQIRQMIAERVLSLSDRVRPESSPDWITIAEMRDAVMAEDNDDDDDEDLEADEDALDINAFRLEGNSDSPMPDDSRPSPDELDINAFQLQGDSDSPLPPARERPVAETTYSVQSLGQVLGPMPHEELLQMARSGALSRGDEIRDEDDGRWLPVEAVPEVAALMARPSAADSASPGSSQAKQAGALKKKKAATGRPTPKRKRRKKKEDPLLKEIFAEVFTDDGKVRDEMKRSSGAAAPAAATALPTAASVPPADDVAGGTDLATSAAATGNTSPPPMTPPPPQSPSPAPPLAASAGAGAAPAPSFHPRPQQAPRKASKSGGGFQMPDPKILGIAGGVLALVLVIVGGVMGIIPLPGFGINAAGFLDEFAAAYPKANSGSASDWAAFKEDFGPKARDVARALAPDVATDPEAKRFQMAALLVVRIVAAAQDDKERQEEMFADFKKVMSGS